MQISDCEGGDSHLSLSFPHVFLFGKAHGRPTPNMNVSQRNHLLHQFTLRPSQDRRLLGFLFDTMQRNRVIQGVAACVDSNNQSLRVLRKLLNSRKERKKLKDAMESPHLLVSKRLLEKCLNLLKCVGRDVPYGAVEGRKLKHRCLAMVNRCSKPTVFLTMSPENIGNPRSLRLALKTVSNDAFPAVFNHGCQWGENGEEFLQNIMSAPENSSTLSEGVVQLPPLLSKSHRAGLAKDNPVSFVSENKRMLFDILDILIGLKPEGSGHFSLSAGSSKQKTTHCGESSRKGVFGHAFNFIGVTEDHKRGHLHWHLTLNAGVPASALQQFANLPELCDETSKALDSVCCSELSNAAHISSCMRRVMLKNRHNWEVNAPVLESLHHRNALSMHPQKVNTLKSWDC